MEEKRLKPLSEDFLYELYAAAFRSSLVASVLSQHMKPEYLPDRAFQNLNKVIVAHYRAFKEVPPYGLMVQKLNDDDDTIELLTDIMDGAGNTSIEAIIGTLEEYIKTVKLQNVYKEIGQKYNRGKSKEAMDLMIGYTDWVQSFTLQENSFVDIIGGFKENYKDNKSKVQEQKKSAKKDIKRFYIDELDALNNAKNLRGQCTCFLAGTGVGKTHVARHIGKHGAIDDGLNVLHIQLEGSREECVDAYSGALIEENSLVFERAKLSDDELEQAVEKLKKYSGTIRVRAYSRFNNSVSTVDVKNCCAEYRKTYGIDPDIVIIDSMDLLTDSSGRNWSEDGIRHKMIAVSKDLKDLAAEENVWLVVTYQATVEKPDLINDPKYVHTEYSVSESKGLSRALTHLITLNQTSDERKAHQMRLHIAKSRFFRKGDTFKIVTDFDREIFYDRQKTFALQRQVE